MLIREYNKSELFSTIDKISIEKKENQVITKFDDRIIKIANVSKLYEVFDISKYLKDKIELIEKNFEIHSYSFLIKGGIQYLKLFSDMVKIGDDTFYKTFYILNSSDKSRTLNFSTGLYSTNNFHIVSNNLGFTKKHYRGVTEAAEIASNALTGETFDEQISAMNSLLGHQVRFSLLRKVILEEVDGVEISKTNHNKLDMMKNLILKDDGSSGLVLEGGNLKDLVDLMKRKSEDIKSIEGFDFYVDAFWALKSYLRIFKNEDSHIIKNETRKVMNITKWAVRNARLESIGI